MSVGLTSERAELGRSVRGFISRYMPMSAVRRSMAALKGFDPEVWRQLTLQLALPGIAVPEAHGGSGYGYADLAVVFEEFGRGLIPLPFFSTTALALPALLAAEDETASNEYAPQLAGGSKIATLAWMEDGEDRGCGVQTTARPIQGGWRVEGNKSYVLDASAADLIFTTAKTSNGLSLFAVAATAPGVSRTPLPTFDQTRPLGRIAFQDVPARLIGEDGAGRQILSSALDRAAALLAAEMVGGAEACLDMSIEYAKARKQFGRPIGSFQAIKHKCAEVLVEVEGARAAAYYAAWSADDSQRELPVAACIAKASASEAFFRAAAENVQIHAGIGATWEHDAHLYLKRAKTSYILLGDPSYHRQRLADRIGLS